MTVVLKAVMRCTDRWHRGSWLQTWESLVGMGLAGGLEDWKVGKMGLLVEEGG